MLKFICKLFGACVVVVLALSACGVDSDGLDSELATLEQRITDLEEAIDSQVIENISNLVKQIVDENPEMLRGPQGIEGEVGPAGPIGQVGPAGPVGPQGPEGPFNSDSFSKSDLTNCIDDLLYDLNFKLQWHDVDNSNFWSVSTDSHYDSGFSSSHNHSISSWDLNHDHRFGWISILRPWSC